jgi:predicted TPR repeat methyltransferase
VAGDVLIYVGDLAPVMPAVSRALKPGGLFACSIEEYAGNGFFLHSESRFSHSMSYMREQADAARLVEIAARQIPIRRNEGADVPGWILVFARK